jgi:hypothetical protein
MLTRRSRQFFHAPSMHIYRDSFISIKQRREDSATIITTTSINRTYRVRHLLERNMFYPIIASLFGKSDLGVYESENKKTFLTERLVFQVSELVASMCGPSFAHTFFDRIVLVRCYSFRSSDSSIPTCRGLSINAISLQFESQRTSCD